MNTQERSHREGGGGDGEIGGGGGGKKDDRDNDRASATESQTFATPAAASSAVATSSAAVASAAAAPTSTNATDALKPASRWTKHRQSPPRPISTTNDATTTTAVASAAAAPTSTNATDALKPASRWTKHRQRPPRPISTTNDATATTAVETSLCIPASSSSPVLNDTGNTSSSQDRNEDDNGSEDVDVLPSAQPLDCSPDFLKRVQSRVVQLRNREGQVVALAERLDTTTSAIDQQQQGGQLSRVLGGLAILFVSLLVVSILVIFLKDSRTPTGQDDNLMGGLYDQQTNNATEPSIEAIVALLRSNNVTDSNDPASSWSNNQSDPYRAVEWMSNNIGLPDQLSPETIVQYYALATMYFALGNEGWLPPYANSSFCDWQHVLCNGNDSATELSLGK
jgi:hypothetical protein